MIPNSAYISRRRRSRSLDDLKNLTFKEECEDEVGELGSVVDLMTYNRRKRNTQRKRLSVVIPRQCLSDDIERAVHKRRTSLPTLGLVNEEKENAASNELSTLNIHVTNDKDTEEELNENMGKDDNYKNKRVSLTQKDIRETLLKSSRRSSFTASDIDQITTSLMIQGTLLKTGDEDEGDSEDASNLLQMDENLMTGFNRGRRCSLPISNSLNMYSSESENSLCSIGTSNTSNENIAVASKMYNRGRRCTLPAVSILPVISGLSMKIPRPPDIHKEGVPLKYNISRRSSLADIDRMDIQAAVQRHSTDNCCSGDEEGHGDLLKVQQRINLTRSPKLRRRPIPRRQSVVETDIGSTPIRQSSLDEDKSALLVTPLNRQRRGSRTSQMDDLQDINQRRLSCPQNSLIDDIQRFNSMYKEQLKCDIQDDVHVDENTIENGIILDSETEQVINVLQDRIENELDMCVISDSDEEKEVELPPRTPEPEILNDRDLVNEDGEIETSGVLNGSYQARRCWCTRCQLMYRMYREDDEKLENWGNYPCFHF